MAEAYRADQVGSLLRPQKVKDTREAFQQGRIDRDQLREVEDNAILDALEREKEIGIEVFSDGEFRRSGFQNDIAEAVEGFIYSQTPAVARIWQGGTEQPKEGGALRIVAGPLKPHGRFTDVQTAFLKEHAPGPFKMTVPSANQFPTVSYQQGLTDKYYKTRSDLLWAISDIVKTELKALVEDDGVPYVQIDAPRYSYYVDPKWREHLQSLGYDPEQALDEAIAADNSCLEGLRRPGVTVAFHICRGNNQSMWYARGGYGPIAEKVFNSLNVDRWLLEYDTERAGTFEPLQHMPKDKMVVLGLISSKTGDLESQDALLRRIDEASKYVPLERLALSPQCGFASMAAGNMLTEEQQWRKLELVVDTARKVWG